MGQYKVKDWIKSQATMMGYSFLIAGFCLWVLIVVLGLVGLTTDIALLRMTELAVMAGLSVGLFSVAVAFIAVGISAEADKRQTDLLKRIDRSVTLWPALVKGDMLTPPGQLAAKEAMSEQSRIEAQKRLDADTKTVGLLRGEVYQLEDGTWAIHWGGKYPL